MNDGSMKPHFWEYCDFCLHDVVICGKCGNNTCNGGYGKADDKECDACPSAYEMYLNQMETKKMTPAQVRRKALTIKKHLDKWKQEYSQLQETCSHPNAIGKKDGSTGNWDRGDDCYWINYHCADCEKRWMTDQ